MEDQLIIAAKKQDNQAFTALYHKYKRYWFTICLRYNSNRQNAQDCLQNALVKIFKNINAFDAQKGSFKSWSARIVINENISFVKSEQNHITEQIHQLEETISEEDINRQPLSKEHLVSLLQKLPLGYRQVFNLYVMEGYRHAEISEILGISVGASKSQLFKARKMLQGMLEFAMQK